MVLKSGTEVFPGWTVVTATSVLLALGFGTIYALPTLAPSLELALGVNRTVFSLAFAVAIVVAFLSGTVTGPVADRVGPRPVVVCGLTLVVAGLAATAAARGPIDFVIRFGLPVGLGVGMIYVPSIATVQRWFLRRRGLASGLAVTGSGIGTIVLPMLTAYLVAKVGWREALLDLAMIVAVLGFPFAWLVDGEPARRGLHPDGAAEPPSAGAEATGATLAQAVRTRTFWLLWIVFVALAVVQFLPLVHMAPYALAKGASETEAAALIGLIGAGSTVGRFLFGWLGDIVGRKACLCAMVFAGALGLGVWPNLDSLAALAVLAGFFGAIYGGYIALGPAVVTGYFGTRAAGGIIGTLYSSRAVAVFVGPVFAGAAFDKLGSYDFPIILGAAVCLCTALLALFLPEPPSATVADVSERLLPADSVAGSPLDHPEPATPAARVA
jgi:MFS family permease